MTSVWIDVIGAFGGQRKDNCIWLSKWLIWCLEQENIPVGCIPTVAVASTLGGVGYHQIPYPLYILPPGYPTPRIPYPQLPYPLDILPLDTLPFQIPYHPDLVSVIPYPLLWRDTRLWKHYLPLAVGNYTVFMTLQDIYYKSFKTLTPRDRLQHSSSTWHGLRSPRRRWTLHRNSGKRRLV